jgi:hypothetical protein
MTFDLPEFVICAFEARVAEANADARPEDCLTLREYVESEMVNLISVRDVAVLDLSHPGFAEAVQEWIVGTRD